MTPEQLESSAVDFSLASMLASYPDQEFEATLTALRPVLQEHGGAASMLRWLDAQVQGVEALRSLYIELFDSGKQRVSLYETEYGRMRGAAKGNDLADIAGFYQAFGFVLDEATGHEMLDHLAVELEFHALMLTKQAYLLRNRDAEGCAIVEDAMRKFLGHHLAAFVAAVAARAELRDDPAYGEALAWAARLVSDECERLAVHVKPLDYFVDAELDREPRCATSLPVVQ